LGRNQKFRSLCRHTTTLPEAMWKTATPPAMVVWRLSKLATAGCGGAAFGGARAAGSTSPAALP
jgi:hypothetical protein